MMTVTEKTIQSVGNSKWNPNSHYPLSPIIMIVQICNYWNLLWVLSNLWVLTSFLMQDPITWQNLQKLHCLFRQLHVTKSNVVQDQSIWRLQSDKRSVVIVMAQAGYCHQHIRHLVCSNNCHVLFAVVKSNSNLHMTFFLLLPSRK